MMTHARYPHTVCTSATLFLLDSAMEVIKVIPSISRGGATVKSLWMEIILTLRLIGGQSVGNFTEYAYLGP